MQTLIFQIATLSLFVASTPSVEAYFSRVALLSYNSLIFYSTRAASKTQFPINVPQNFTAVVNPLTVSTTSFGLNGTGPANEEILSIISYYYMIQQSIMSLACSLLQIISSIVQQLVKAINSTQNANTFIVNYFLKVFLLL